MLILLSILLLFVPTVFQYKIGNKSLRESIDMSFLSICVISLIIQFVITIVSFLLSIYSITSAGNKCATGAVAIPFFSFFITIFMLIVMLLQYSRRKRYNKEQIEQNE
ncbi:hypothetical protein [Flavobacterium sp. HJJ]|uniref:hypothetical protein n=1 Tax=Flavobacterium sp. HJJ TaxID=2783792 RepID=UPI00188D7D94|nr:hypothetical protein [Flavobacterium sp. HJJ]MBF4470093.1 hypothetical protein [Flavobacterium sp. HJJ]